MQEFANGHGYESRREMIACMLSRALSELSHARGTMAQTPTRIHAQLPNVESTTCLIYLLNLPKNCVHDIEIRAVRMGGFSISGMQ